MKRVIFILSIIIGLFLSQDLYAQGQCKATTKKGTQCKRKASDDSGYCFQHKKLSNASEATTKEKTTKVAKKKTSVSNSSSSTETYNGHEVITGPRGGKYYINKNGNKTYIKR